MIDEVLDFDYVVSLALDFVVKDGDACNNY